MKLKMIVAAVAALAAISSHAAADSWGTHSALELDVTVLPTGSFFDTYSFSLDAKSIVTGGVESFGALVGGFSVWGMGSDGVIGTSDDYGIAGAAFGGKTSLTLDSGSYYYAVAGYGFTAGGYAIASSAMAAPVPEPETYALLGAGLGIVGFVASRRRRQD